MMNIRQARPSVGAAAYYMAYFGVVGVFLPFFPIFLADRSLGENEIAVILAAPLAMRIVFAPMAGAVADRLADRSHALVLYSWMACLSFALLAIPYGFVWMLLVTVVFAVFWTAIIPVIDTITLGIGEQTGADYGRIRLWGSVAFIATNLGAGYALQGRHGEAVFQILLAGFLMIGLTSFLVSSAGAAARPAGASAVPGSGTGIVKLLAIPGFGAVLAAASLVQASHAMVYGFGTLFWEELGLPRWQIGVLWAFGVAVEVLLFACAAFVLKRIRPLQLILVGAGAAVLRWAAFPFLDSFSAFLALQGLHGLTFGATYLGTVHYISAAAPSELAARAQSLYATVGGVGMALAMLVSGPLYGAYSGAGVAAMAAFALLAIALIVVTPALKRALAPL